MKPIYAARPRPSMVKIAAFSLAFLLLAAGGTIAGLFYFGILRLPQAEQSKAAKKEPPPGTVAVPLAVRPLKAFSVITREDLFDPKTNAMKVIHLPTEEVARRGIITSFNDLLGRVVNRDKSTGYSFTEKDLLPQGTRSGLVAGIPPGKRAIALDMSKVHGVVYLKSGDHFDLLAAWPIKSSDLGKKLAAELHGAKRAGVKVVVNDGIVITPVVPVKKAGKKIGDRPPPEQEIIVAVDAEEIGPLTEALATNAEMTCVARSGRPDDPGPASVIPAFDPVPRVRTIEVLVGSRRETIVYPIAEGE